MILLTFVILMVVSLVLGSVVGLLLHKWNTRRVSLDTREMDNKLAAYEYAQYQVQQKALADYNNSLR